MFINLLKNSPLLVNFIIILMFPWQVLWCKGQSISKAIYGLLDSPTKRTKLTILSIFYNSEFCSFFCRIENTIIFFQDCLLTFSKYKIGENKWIHKHLVHVDSLIQVYWFHNFWTPSLFIPYSSVIRELRQLANVLLSNLYSVIFTKKISQ